ncbi:MAG: type IV secretory system conjugative DNA transfer family protein [Rickettsiaceae bacterium]
MNIQELRNVIGRILVIIILLIISGLISTALMMFLSDNFDRTAENSSEIQALYVWTIWLIDNWSELSISDYDYLKIKITVSLLSPLILMTIVYIALLEKIRSINFFSAQQSAYGDAHWATNSDVQRANLRSKQGMLLGCDSHGYFVASGYEHALLFAPTGSGKGVGFVIPNALFWDQSMIVHDIKLENYEKTSGWRESQGQEVFVWEPSNPNGITHCYNPIDWVSPKPGQMVDDVQKISNLIIPDQKFWENEARTLFSGIVLYLMCDDTKVKSFGEVVRTIRSDDVAYNLAVALDTLGEVMHPVGYMNIAAFLQKADKERSGVVSTLSSGLELWANPLIDAATASSDFNIMEIKKKKTTIYVGLTPDNLTRLQKLMQVFYQQATEFLTRVIPDPKEEPYGVLFLMDEFPTLGKMDQFKSGIAFFRGYNVRLFLVVQDTQQLKGIYEESGMNSFLSNSKYRITFAANNYETANLISQLCGNQTIKQSSYSGPAFASLNFSSHNKSVSNISRALLLPQEVLTLPRDEQIILIESFPPIKSKKIQYYTDKAFTIKLMNKTHIPTQKPFDIRQFRRQEE